MPSGQRVTDSATWSVSRALCDDHDGAAMFRIDTRDNWERVAREVDAYDTQRFHIAPVARMLPP